MTSTGSLVVWNVLLLGMTFVRVRGREYLMYRVLYSGDELFDVKIL
jgi:hypothetical protein